MENPKWKIWPKGYLNTIGVTTEGNWHVVEDGFYKSQTVMSFCKKTHFMLIQARDNGDLFPVLDPRIKSTWVLVLMDLVERVRPDLVHRYPEAQPSWEFWKLPEEGWHLSYGAISVRMFKGIAARDASSALLEALYLVSVNEAG